MSINSFSRNTATYLYGYLHATVADLSDCLRNQMVHKPKIVIRWPFTEEALMPKVESCGIHICLTFFRKNFCHNCEFSR